MNPTVNGILIIPLIIGATEFMKRFGMTGNRALANAFGFGVCFGLGYQLTLGVPTDFSGWFGAVIYGLALGLSAAGLYDFSARFSPPTE